MKPLRQLKPFQPMFESRNKVLKGKTAELKSSLANVTETKYHNLTFLSITNPESETLETINQNYQFHHLAIEDCLSEFQRSKIEQYENYIHIILQLPIYDNDSIVPAEVNFFVSDTYMVLVHWENLPHLKTFIDAIVYNKSAREDCMENGIGYLLYKFIDLLVIHSFNLIDNIEKQVRNTEKKIFSTLSYDDSLVVREIARLRRDIMAIQRITKPQIYLISFLERIKGIFVNQELDLYFGDIGDHINKQWEIISDQHELIINLNNTNESLISVRTNTIMKTLTLISVIVLPLTLISGTYGMNVELPLAHNHYAFWFILFLKFSVVIGMLLFFKQKKWI